MPGGRRLNKREFIQRVGPKIVPGWTGTEHVALPESQFNAELAAIAELDDRAAAKVYEDEIRAAAGVAAMRGMSQSKAARVNRAEWGRELLRERLEASFAEERAARERWNVADAAIRDRVLAGEITLAVHFLNDMRYPSVRELQENYPPPRELMINLPSLGMPGHVMFDEGDVTVFDGPEKNAPPATPHIRNEYVPYLITWMRQSTPRIFADLDDLKIARRFTVYMREHHSGVTLPRPRSIKVQVGKIRASAPAAT